VESRRRRREAAEATDEASTPRGIKYGIDAPSTRTAEKVSGIDTPSKPTALKGDFRHNRYAGLRLDRGTQ